MHAFNTLTDNVLWVLFTFSEYKTFSLKTNVLLDIITTLVNLYNKICNLNSMYDKMTMNKIHLLLMRTGYSFNLHILLNESEFLFNGI